MNRTSSRQADADDLADAARTSGITWERPPPESSAEPGYCVACGDFHLLTPAPDWGGGACAQCLATRRLDPPEPGDRHVCNTSDRLKPGHPEYRQCSCGQWLHSGGGYWYRIPHPPSRWLREHGCDPADFWTQDDDHGPRFFEEIPARRPSLLMLLRWLLRR